MVPEELEERFDAATAFIDSMLAELIHDIGLDPFVETRDSLTSLFIAFTPGIEMVLPPGGGVSFDVDENVAAYLAGAAHEMPEAMDIVKHVSSLNIAAGRELPQAFRVTVSLMLAGTFSEAKRRGAPLTGNFGARWLLRSMAIFVRDTFELSLTRHDGPQTLSACDAVCQVAERHGISVKYNALRDWCSHPKYVEFRRRADGLTNCIQGSQHAEQGVTGQAELFGPILELARMRSNK